MFYPSSAKDSLEIFVFLAVSSLNVFAFQSQPINQAFSSCSLSVFSFFSLTFSLKNLLGNNRNKRKTTKTILYIAIPTKSNGASFLDLTLKSQSKRYSAWFQAKKNSTAGPIEGYCLVKRPGKPITSGK